MSSTMKVVLRLGALISFLSTFYFGLQNSAKVMFVSVLSMVILLIFSEIERFAEFRFYGASARLRDMMEQAHATIAQVQRLALVQCAAIIHGIATTGRWSGNDDDYKFKLVSEIEEILRELEVDETDVKQAVTEWYQYKALDHVHALLGHNRIPKSVSDAGLIERWKELRSRPLNNLPAPDELREFIIACGVLDSKREERIEDYRCFLENWRLRRPEEWKNNRQWTLETDESSHG